MQQDRLRTNPALGSRKLKLGTFQTNLDSACVMSGLEDRFRLSWPNTVALAKLADEMELEAIVPVARWRGFGGATNPQGPGFEAYTWAAGIAASTAYSGVFSTSHVSLNHPVIAAKQSAAIDHISNGRFTLNIVCGWNGPEMEMFGSDLGRHEDRYARAEEWLAIVAAYHRLAHEEYNRTVKVWTHACVVQGETEKEARDFYDYYVHQLGDWTAANNVIDAMAAEANEKQFPPERRKAIAEMFIAGWGGHPLVGTKEQIVDKLAGLSRMGMDGVLLSWPRFEPGMREFRDTTLPLLKQAGLR